ncbi:MAG: rod shape-determining protein MreC [Planctomycetota bacterium]|jgi:cell shape-determining protein MreC
MAGNKTRVPRRILFTWFTLGGFIFFFAPETWTNKLQLAFAYIFHRPLSIGRNLSLSACGERSAGDAVSRKRYNKLHNYLANTLERLNLAHEKVEKLSGLRDRSVWEGVNFVLADVITTSIGGSHARLIINRGLNDGLARDQFVLGDYSVIGTISDVDARTAQVKLITDPTLKITVKVADGSQSNPAAKAFCDELQDAPPLIMQGRGQKSAKIQLLPARYKIQSGDMVYIQKKPALLGTPTITGRVARCKRDYENPLLWDITVEPACDIEKLKDVAVIVMNPQK